MEAENSIQTVAIRPTMAIRRAHHETPIYYSTGKKKNGKRNAKARKAEPSQPEEQLPAQSTEFAIDLDYLRSLNPKEWKDQDHYRVLGVHHLRHKATEDDIRRAYRKIVLKHHPDKRKALGEDVRPDDDYFTCITKAYETLGNQQKRRSYDSVDPFFDDTLPTNSEVNNNFYKTCSKYFQLNARWSEKPNVPEIGDEHATREHVDNFYNFWYSFESWREYSYLDEEDKERGQDREERRWIEKQNKAIRIKRKKEEMSRIRTLVDLAYNNDPRILKFKNEDKEKKQAAKRARMTAAQAQRAEEEKIIREAQLAKEKAEQAEQKRIEQIRLEKEKEKKALKKERKMLRDLAKENNYYSTSDKEKIKHMEGVEKICEMLKYLELQGFNKELAAGGQKCFKKMLDETEQRLEEERKALFNTHKAQTVTSIKQVDKNAMWSPENVQILIKAVNLFPAGTVQRWEVIANYINQHGNSAEGKVTARDVLNKAKTMQSSDFKQDVLKQQVNNNAFESFEKSRKDLKKIDNAEISVNVNGYSEVPKQNGTDAKKKSKVTANETNAQNQNNDSINAAEGTNASTWTKEEQALLEQAMKTYPVSTVDRWDRIAECIPDRTKKDCLRRVKELVDLVNAKREAQKIKK